LVLIPGSIMSISTPLRNMPFLDVWPHSFKLVFCFSFRK